MRYSLYLCSPPYDSWWSRYSVACFRLWRLLSRQRFHLYRSAHKSSTTSPQRNKYITATFWADCSVMGFSSCFKPSYFSRSHRLVFDTTFFCTIFYEVRYICVSTSRAFLVIVIKRDLWNRLEVGRSMLLLADDLALLSFKQTTTTTTKAF